MKTKIFLLSIVCLGFISCSKKKDTAPADASTVTTEMASGLNDNPQAIHGYLYACTRRYSANTYTYMYCYASFNDPEKKLLKGYDHFNDNTSNQGTASNFGNIDVGQITFSDFTINKNAFIPNVFYSQSYYNYNYNYTLPTAAGWTTEGNLSYKPLDIKVPRGFPVVPAISTSSIISISSEFTVDLSGLSNYDSVIVTLTDNYSHNIKKKGIAGTSSVTFSVANMAQLYTTGNGYLQVFAYNYSNITIENKVYLFELSNKYLKAVVINP